MDQPEAFGAEREIPLKNGTIHSCMCCKGVSFYCGLLFWRQHCLSENSGPQSLWEVPTLRHSSWKSWTAFPCSNTNVCASGSVEGALSDPGSAKDGVAPPCSAHCHCPLLHVYGRDYRATKSQVAGLILVCPRGSALQDSSM